MEKIWKMSRIKIRNLTKNEKILFIILGIVIFIWTIYRFILLPQFIRLEALESQKIDYLASIDEMNQILKMESQVNKELNVLHKEKEDLVSRYFPKIDQAQIIYLLNNLLEDNNIAVDNFNFNRPYYEDIEGFQVRNMDVSIPYGGSYDGIVELLSSIKNSPRKILVESLSIDRNASSELSGNMALKVYSLEGIAESDQNIVYIDTPTEISKETPFTAFNDYTSSIEAVDDEEKTIEEISPYIEKILIDFEVRNNYFLPSEELVKGDVSLSTNSKSKKYSLRLEYNIIAVGETNRAYVDVTKNNVVLKHPPNNIGLWVYAYDYSPTTLGIGFRGQMGEEIFVPFAEGINWTGWKYIEATPPSDLNLYPLDIDSIYLEMPKDRDDYGVLLIDKLEAVYPRNVDGNGKDRSIGDYIFHIVEKGESIDSISKMYYGTSNYKNEIIKLNELKSDGVLPIGKVLVLKKR